MHELAQSSGSPLGIPVPVLVFVGFAAFIVLMFLTVSQAARKRREAIERRLGEMGFAASLAPGQQERAGVISCVGALHERLRTGQSGVKWCARSGTGGHAVVLFEHSYTTGSGKNSRTVTTTVAASPCPQNWAIVALSNESVFTWIGKQFGMKDLELEDPAFNKQWRVKTDDENFALALLGPEVQRVLADSAARVRGETWQIGRGSVCLVIERSVAPEELGAIPQRLAGVINAMEPTLREMVQGSAF